MPVRRPAAGALSTPLTLLLVGGVLAPAGVLLVYSFYGYALYQITPGFSLSNYTQVFTDGLYSTLAVNTLAIAVPTTLVSVAGGYAIAYYVVFVAGRDRAAVFGLVIVSMLASYLARVYAWRTLMGSTGIVNSLLTSLGLVHQPLGFLVFSRFAVVLAEVTLYLPIAALIAYSGLAGVPGDVREAARDLGASRAQTLRRVVLPVTGQALFGASALVFFLSCGDYITPVFLGGPSSSETFGTTIATQMITEADYPSAAALSFVMTLAFALYAVLLAGGLRATGMLPRRHAR